MIYASIINISAAPHATFLMNTISDVTIATIETLQCNTAAGIDRIKRALAPNMLLILDEMHLLQYTYRINSFFACMEVIREIYDEVHCGLVLCGTTLFLEKLQQGKHGETCDQAN